MNVFGGFECFMEHATVFAFFQKAVTWYVQQVNNWVTEHVTWHVGVACSTCMASRLCSVLGPSSMIDPLVIDIGYLAS